MPDAVEKAPAGRHSVEERIGVLEELLSERYSCRAFRPDPVPRSTIEHILTAAQKTASWCNSQPWQVVIATGEARRNASAIDLCRGSFSGRPDDHDFHVRRANISGSISIAAARAASSSTIRSAYRAATRRPTPDRRWRIINFFGAPHVAIVHTTRRSASTARSIAAAMSANFMLAAQAFGAGHRCRRRRWRFIPRLVRNHFDLGDDRRVVCGISFGFPDHAHKANSYRTTRAAHCRYRHLHRRIAETATGKTPIADAIEVSLAGRLRRDQ